MTKAMTLEAAIARLEEIVALMGGDLTVEESVKLYGEAVKLVDFANKKLEAARLKIEKLDGEAEDGQV